MSSKRENGKEFGRAIKGSKLGMRNSAYSECAKADITNVKNSRQRYHLHNNAREGGAQEQR